MRLGGYLVCRCTFPVLAHPHLSKEPAHVRCVPWRNNWSCQVLFFPPLTRLTELLLTLGFNTPDERPHSAREMFRDWMSLRIELLAELTFKMPGQWGSGFQQVREQEQACAWEELVKNSPAHLGWEGNAADAGGMSKELEINQQRGEDERARLGEGVFCISVHCPATSLAGRRAGASCCCPD